MVDNHCVFAFVSQGRYGSETRRIPRIVDRSVDIAM